MIDPSVVVGTDCRIHASAVIDAGVVLGADVWIGAGCVLLGPCHVGDHCRLGAGCILDPGECELGEVLRLESDVRLLAGVVVPAPVTIASGAYVQAGTVLTRSVPPHATVSGNPAQIIGYASTPVESQQTDAAAKSVDGAVGSSATRVRDVTLHLLPRILDLRGNLSVGEFDRSIPFEPKRYFLVFGVPNAEVRGEHAHRTCKQFLICVKGRCSVVADDGIRREEFLLDDPATGVYLPPLTWGVQYKYSADAVLLVFASEYYDSAEYIRDYDEFKRLSQSGELAPVP